jgi:hypothetical protein
METMQDKIQLTGDERIALDQKIDDFRQSGSLRTFSLEKSIHNWRSLVEAVEIGYGLGVYDYTNELTNRDILQRFLDTLPKTLEVHINESIKPIDDTLLSLTDESDMDLLGAGGEWQSKAWWWHRLPKKIGDELKEDLESLS